VTVTTVALLYAIGGALLALWVIARFPTFGPRTMLGAGVAFGLPLLLEPALPPAVGLAEHAAGHTGALLFVVLPFLTFVFWASGRMLYCLVALVAPRLK
jgi:hypothetical protein